MKVVPAAFAIAISLLPMIAYSGPSAFRDAPSSGVRITKAWLNEHQQSGETGVCAAFMVTGTVEVTRVEFLYSLIGKDGKILYTTIHEAKGEFAPSVLIQGENQATCDTAYGLYYGGGKVMTRAGEGSLVISVSQVDFADGTYWHAGPDVRGGALMQPDASVRILRSFSWEPGSSTNECAVFENRGAQTIRHVHLLFSHIADDGSDVVDDPFDAYPTLVPGGTATACRGWNGSLTPRVGTPPSSGQPEVLVFDKPARLVAWTSQIDFANNTSWHTSQPGASALASAAVPAALDYTHAVW